MVCDRQAGHDGLPSRQGGVTNSGTEAGWRGQQHPQTGGHAPGSGPASGAGFAAADLRFLGREAPRPAQSRPQHPATRARSSPGSSDGDRDSGNAQGSPARGWGSPCFWKSGQAAVLEAGAVRAARGQASIPAGSLPPHPSLVRGRELWNPGRQPPQPAVRFQMPLQGPCGNFKLRKSKVCISVTQPAASESCDGTSGRAHFGNSEEHRARRRAAQDRSGRGGLAGRGWPLGAGHAGPPSLRNMSKRRDRAARNPRHRAGVTATRPRRGISKQPRTPLTCFARTPRRVLVYRQENAHILGVQVDFHTGTYPCDQVMTRNIPDLERGASGRPRSPPARPALRVDFVPSARFCLACRAHHSCEWARGRSAAPGCPFPIRGHRTRSRVAAAGARLCEDAARPGLRDVSLSRVSRQHALLTPRRTQHPHSTRAARWRQGGSPSPSQRRGHASAARQLPGLRGRSAWAAHAPRRPCVGPGAAVWTLVCSGLHCSRAAGSGPGPGGALSSATICLPQPLA